MFSLNVSIHLFLLFPLAWMPVYDLYPLTSIWQSHFNVVFIKPKYQSIAHQIIYLVMVFTLFLLVFNVHFSYFSIHSFIKMFKTNSEGLDFQIILPVNFCHHFHQNKLCTILIFVSSIWPSIPFITFFPNLENCHTFRLEINFIY